MTYIHTHTPPYTHTQTHTRARARISQHTDTGRVPIIQLYNAYRLTRIHIDTYSLITGAHRHLGAHRHTQAHIDTHFVYICHTAGNPYRQGLHHNMMVYNCNLLNNKLWRRSTRPARWQEGLHIGGETWRNRCGETVFPAIEIIRSLSTCETAVLIYKYPWRLADKFCQYLVERAVEAHCRVHVKLGWFTPFLFRKGLFQNKENEKNRRELFRIHGV